jgi:hypothetical protein
MGLLDDAIREHLDLKRRRGADPAEIERAEREALGPVRRGPETEPADFPDDQLAAEPEGVAYDDDGFEEQEDYYEEAPEEPPFGHVEPASPPDLGAADAEDPFAEHGEDPFDELATRVHPGAGSGFEDDEPAVEPTSQQAEPAFHEAEPAAAPEREPELHAPPRESRPPEPDTGDEERPPHIGQETAEYDVEQEIDNEADDVLEETPEFLQDTPDHDRLWFEQRPPKDFDFDG